MTRLLIIIMCFISLPALAQDAESDKDPADKKQITTRGFEAKIDAGYYGGVLINLNFVVYNSGFGANFAGGYRVNDYFATYAGFGLERLEDGVLIPFYLDFEAYFSPKKKGYLDARIGYSTGFNNRSINIEYDYDGGPLFGIGVGRDLYTNEHLRLGVNFSYNYRQAKYSYQPFDESEKLTSNFDYHLFSGKIAFAFR